MSDKSLREAVEALRDELVAKVEGQMVRAVCIVLRLDAILSAPEPSREEYAWLIERPGHEWWTAISYHSDGSTTWEWSKDALDAVRFCRREDAAKVAVAVGISAGAEVTEHGFSALLTAPEPSREELREKVEIDIETYLQMHIDHIDADLSISDMAKGILSLFPAPEADIDDATLPLMPTSKRTVTLHEDGLRREDKLAILVEEVIATLSRYKTTIAMARELEKRVAVLSPAPREEGRYGT